MNYEIVDTETKMLDNWFQAMPSARVVLRSAISNQSGDCAKIRWCRLRAGEKPADVLPRQLMPKAHVVVFADEPSDALTLEILAAGAAGCCNTHAAPEVLQQVALVVENGGLWVGQSLLQQLVGGMSRALAQRQLSSGNAGRLSGLSEREGQVAKLVADGASNKEIAEQLSIAERTVKAHLTAIFEKTGARDRLQLSLKVNGLNR